MTTSRIEELSNEAWAHYDSGRPEPAGRLFQEILDIDPGNAEAWMMVGVAQAQSGNADGARASLVRAIELDPQYPDAYLHLARVQAATGQLGAAVTNARMATQCDAAFGDAWLLLAELSATAGDTPGAESSYRRLLQLEPGRADVRNRLAAICAVQGRFDEAVHECREALRSAPDNPEIHANLGNVYAGHGDNVDAIACFQRALQLAPEFAGARLNLGNTFSETGQHRKAAECYRRLVDENPGFVDAHISLGGCYLKLGEFAQALACYDAVLTTVPDSPVALMNRGVALGHLEQNIEALRTFNRLLELDPEHVEAWRNRGMVEKRLGNFEAAVTSMKRALSLSPGNLDARLSLGLLELSQGNFRDGWRNYLARRSVRDRAVVDPAHLSGDLGEKRLLLVKDQGLGDEIFFLRFATLLKARGAWLACQTDPKIRTIVERIPVLDAVITEMDKPPAVDLTIPVADLPFLLQLNAEHEFPPPIGLTVLPGASDNIRSILAQAGPGPFVGVTWWAGTQQSAGGAGDRLAYRDVPLQALAGVVRASGGTAVVLQRNPKPEELAELSAIVGREIIDMSALNDDLEGMLALLSCIDDYIGVDNTNMHLSAGLGRPCRILVPHPPEWRMMTTGAQSPWFPGFTLYRQDISGDWQAALMRLEVDLITSLRR